MEEKQLDAQESIELISRMIRNTRRRMERNSGRPFLIWGYTTVGISLLNYWFRRSSFDPDLSITWFLIPVIGFVLMKLFPAKKSSEPSTDIDRIVGAVWTTGTLSLIPIFIMCLFHGLAYRPSLFAWITLSMAIATAATGLIVRLRIYTAAGFAGMALSTLFAFYDFYLKSQCSEAAGGTITLLINNEILIFAAIFIVMMVIPGHILNYKSNHLKE